MFGSSTEPVGLWCRGPAPAQALLLLCASSFRSCNVLSPMWLRGKTVLRFYLTHFWAVFYCKESCACPGERQSLQTGSV